MKQIKKMMALALAMVMVLAMSTAVFAATITKNPTDLTGPASITVTLPTVEDGTTGTNQYKIYKVFDATVSGENISYTLVDGKSTAPTGFTVKNGYVTHEGDATELTSAEISAIAFNVGASDLVATIDTTTGTDTSFTVSGLPYGYYYITTTTGTVVIVNSTNPNASVTDKNTVPGVDKTITGATGDIDDAGKNAIAQVGTTVTYTATVTVGNGVQNYVYHDNMGSGLAFTGSVTIDGATAGTDYTLKTGDDADEGDTFTIEFDNEFIGGKSAGDTFTIVYTATITNDALTVTPEENTATLTYGDSNHTNTTPESKTDVYSAKISVTKKAGSASGAGLEGAGFVLKNGDNKYYQLTAASGSNPATIAWVDDIANATEFTSDRSGALDGEFIGLIPGSYTLIEKTVPASYNKADDQSFTIVEENYTAANLEQATTVINEQGSILPSTGGIGTTIFYIVGAILVVGAGILLVTRRRMNAE